MIATKNPVQQRIYKIAVAFLNLAHRTLDAELPQQVVYHMTEDFQPRHMYVLIVLSNWRQLHSFTIFGTWRTLGWWSRKVASCARELNTLSMQNISMLT